MKKLLVLLLSAALLLSGCAFRAVAQDVEKVLETAPEMEPVETVTVCLHSHTLIYPDGTEEEKVYKFDNRSFPLSCEYYVNDRKTGTDTYTVDEHGNILTSTPDYEGGETRSYAYTYDEQGNVLTKEAFLEGTPDYTEAYTYSESGAMTAKTVTTADGLRTETLYDDQNRETERLEYDRENLVQRTVTEYAEHGKRQLVTVSDGSGNVTIREEYTYDAQASREAANIFDAQGSFLGHRDLYFDTFGHELKEETFDAQGELTLKECWYYLDHVKIDFVEVTEPAS